MTRYALCLLVLLAALGWATSSMLRMESEGLGAAREAEVQERVRLALWRLDAAANPLLIRENSRPPHHFRAFHETEQAFTKGYQQVEKGEVLVPSPLLTERPPHVLLHFEQPVEGGPLTSPQIPTGNQRDLAEARYTEGEQIGAAAAAMEKLLPMASSLCATAAMQCSPIVTPEVTLENPIQQEDSQAWMALNPENSKQQRTALPDFDNQRLKSNQEAAVRNQVAQQGAFDYSASANGYLQAKNPAPQIQAPSVSRMAAAAPPATLPAGPTVAVTPFTPIWLEDDLFLVRRARDESGERLQGVWIDWTGLETELCASISDLLPDAKLARTAPLLADEIVTDPERMVGIPVRLEHGVVSAEVASLPFLGTPLRRSLGLAWLCILAAAASVAALLHGAIQLGERRGAFVSAVTHELRTPLTTFQLYTDLLAEGGIEDPARRNEYLEILRGEAGRLGHLVENVLAYAQLEKGAVRRKAEPVSLGEIIDHTSERLGRRASQAGMELVIDEASPARERVVEVDVGAVEQILFNLVDNACKYAAPSGDSEPARIHLEAAEHGSLGLLRVRDHGCGIRPEEARRLFRPFEKSATEAAHSAPGVGLGLALCRRLSRALGGELRLEDEVDTGASFVLELPAG